MIGRVLVCAAILHSGKWQDASDAEISKCVQTLIAASHYKTFHSSLAFTFLLELLDKLPEKRFKSLMWPQMQKELKRPWEKQNINTAHFLFMYQWTYPALVDEQFLQNTLQTDSILTPAAYKHLSRLFWTPASVMIAVTHPSYDGLGIFLANSVPEKSLLEFWRKEINEILLAPTKLKEIATLRVLTNMLKRGKLQAKTVTSLLSNAFVALITKSLRTAKQDKREEYMNVLYNDFFDAVEEYLATLPSDENGETSKVALIQRFIDRPGTVLLEKYTPVRVIHKLIGKLTSVGVQQLFEFYKGILFDIKSKNAKADDGWLHTEKEHCVQMLQFLLNQKCVQADHEWRTEQLKLLLKLGLFYVSKETQEIRSKDACSDALPTEFAFKLKQSFYSSLQSKTQKLNDEKKMLLAIVEYCNQHITSKSAQKKLRHPLPEKAFQSWQKMYETVTTKKKGKQVLHDVFDILLMHMGLQLFSQTDLAIFSIDDLEKCMERSEKKMKEKKGKTKSQEDSNEAKWIEVVVDLFLQLLSQNKSFLRNVVDNVFPRLCPNMTPTAIDQILAMLDMSEKNPLTPAGEIDDDADEDEDSSDDEMKENGNQSESEEDNEKSDENDSSDDESIVDEEESVAEDDETATDKLRSLVSQALGSALPDTDNDSVDLNDMDDAEAERLDMVLADAFKAINRKTGSGKKKTKLERTTNTVVMHFRIRVLDLLEIYLKTSPSLAITLNILTDLIPMYEHCVTVKDLEPLTNRLKRVLRTLLSLREFASTDDVTEAKLYELFHSIINVKVNPASINEQSKLTSQLSSFLIAVSQLLKSSEPILLETIAECLENFLKSRNPMVQYSFFADVMRLRWVGVWRLGQIIAKTSLLSPTNSRAFRRFQALELLGMMYKNHGFITSDVNEFNEMNKKIEVAIQDYVQWANKQQNTSPKEFSALLQLLQEVHKCSQTIKGHRCTLDWHKICDSVQSIRQRSETVSYQVYFAFCTRMQITVIKNNEINKKNTNGTPKAKTNGQQGSDDDEDEEEVEENTQQKPKTNGSAKKRKADADGTPNGLSKKRKAKLEKKMRKENRLKMSSVGLEGISFNATNVEEVDMDSD